MTLDLSPDTWAQIRHDYEFTDRPVEDICAEHGISAGTLRNRMRRWNWTRRRAPIPADGPPPAPAPQIEDAEDAGARHAAPLPSPQIETARASEDASVPGEGDPATIVPRLQTAVARVLRAIEAAVAKLGAGPAPPREMERSARVLAALTRTLRELSTLLDEHQSRAPAGRICDCDDIPEDIDEFRHRLADRINAFVRSRTGGGETPTPQDT
jgi:transposase-like protein